MTNRGRRGASPPVDSTGESAAGLVGFTAAAALVGVLTGLAAASFRVLLDHGARLRTDLAHWAHGTFWGSPS